MPRTILQTVAREAVRLAGAAATPLAPMALAAGSNGSTALRAALLGRTPGKDTSLSEVAARIDRAGARFDGRLRVVAVDRSSGRRVVFGAPGAPAARVAEAVQASCSVPWIFAPVTIGGREYVDGGVWSNTNLDIAPAMRATQVLCLNPIASLDIALASPFGMLRAIAGSTAAIETLALRSRGAKVRMIGPAHEIGRVMGPNLMDARRRDEVLAGGYAQGLRVGGGICGQERAGMIGAAEHTAAQSSNSIIAVRYVLPAAILLAGIVALLLSDTLTGLEGLAMGIGVAGSVLLLNVLYRVGVKGDLERDDEEAARVYYDEHGRWPDDEPEAERHPAGPPRT